MVVGCDMGRNSIAQASFSLMEGHKQITAVIGEIPENRFIDIEHDAFVIIPGINSTMVQFSRIQYDNISCLNIIVSALDLDIAGAVKKVYEHKINVIMRVGKRRFPGACTIGMVKTITGMAVIIYFTQTSHINFSDAP